MRVVDTGRRRGVVPASRPTRLPATLGSRSASTVTCLCSPFPGRFARRGGLFPEVLGCWTGDWTAYDSREAALRAGQLRLTLKY